MLLSNIGRYFSHLEALLYHIMHLIVTRQSNNAHHNNMSFKPRSNSRNAVFFANAYVQTWLIHVRHATKDILIHLFNA